MVCACARARVRVCEEVCVRMCVCVCAVIVPASPCQDRCQVCSSKQFAGSLRAQNGWLRASPDVPSCQR
jgi:hypothetical protein